MIRFGLLTLSLVICSLNQAASEVYYIKTTPTDLCTGMCDSLALTELAAFYDLHSNTTLVFLPGTHYLRTVLALSNVDNFVMKSENSKAQIKCTSNSHIHFNQSQHIRITNLEFIGCGGNQVTHVEEFVIQDTTFKGKDNSGTALELIETTAQIINSTFESNRKGSDKTTMLNDPDLSISFYGAFNGGAIIATKSIIDISQSKFEYNEADYGGAIFAEQHSIIHLSDNVFINNNANAYGGVLFSIDNTITIEASELRQNSATKGGGGVLFSSSSTIAIEGSEFHDNSATQGDGGVLFFSNSTITLEASKFQHNSAIMRTGGVLYLFHSDITVDFIITMPPLKEEWCFPTTAI